MLLLSWHAPLACDAKSDTACCFIINTITSIQELSSQDWQNSITRLGLLAVGTSTVETGAVVRIGAAARSHTAAAAARIGAVRTALAAVGRSVAVQVERESKTFEKPGDHFSTRSKGCNQAPFKPRVNCIRRVHPPPYWGCCAYCGCWPYCGCGCP
jgi:hypothetical protein